MSPLDDLIARHPLPTWRAAAWPVMALLTGLAVWSVFAELDEVAHVLRSAVENGLLRAGVHGGFPLGS